jgi:hypothetical protein
MTKWYIPTVGTLVVQAYNLVRFFKILQCSGQFSGNYDIYGSVCRCILSAVILYVQIFVFQYHASCDTADKNDKVQLRLIDTSLNSKNIE